jgi:uncharacterized membrane protein
MRLEPFIQADPAIQIHIGAALIAILLGSYQLLARKGSTSHRVLGWVWTILLGSICISSFFIPGSLFLGPISVFHALSVYTLWALFMGVKAARMHEVADHKSYMNWLFSLSLIFSAVIAVGSSGGVLHEMFIER